MVLLQDLNTIIIGKNPLAVALIRHRVLQEQGRCFILWTAREPSGYYVEPGNFVFVPPSGLSVDDELSLDSNIELIMPEKLGFRDGVEQIKEKDFA